MADDGAVGGKSPAQVAHEMALQILLSVEGKKLLGGGLTRKEYLKAHVDCVFALRGTAPD